MYDCKQDVLEHLLSLIESGKCRQALSLWVKHRHADTDACPDCTYKTIDMDNRCCLCLESKLRTMSLYKHTPSSHDDGLLKAARAISRHRLSVSQ